MFRCSICLLCLGLAGCYPDPFQNPGDWSLTGASRQNLAVQVADPSDLITGKSNAYSSGVAAAAGVDKALGGAAGTAQGLQNPPTPPSMNITGS